MAAKAPTKAPTKRKPPTRSTDSPTTEQVKPEQDSPTPEADESSQAGEKSDHPAAQGIPLPTDPSAARLQEEQDELQQPGRVSKAVADQIDNDPGYSKDQLAHMKEYWSHGDAVGEEVVDEEASDDQ